MVVNEDDVMNIMGGMEHTGGIKLNDHKRKLKNRFEICRKLGQGTYGKVQLGVNKETGQQVAIKTIKKSKIETEADLIRIRREIQIMSSVQHPNIIHIYEVFENKEKMVLVMEIAAGGELYDYLSERKCLEETEARRIFRQISTAVYYCHKNNICHRDLKLENILLDENGNAKIADFGLSNVYDGKNLLNTFCGSPLYASPEIVRGSPYAGPEVDCWSLGVLLYTLVYGAMPFDGSNFKRLVKQITTGDYYEPKSPASASSLVRTMLTVSPEKRANIGDICSHWWVNEGYSQTCLEEAEYLASLTPVRLDLLLSLAPAPKEAAATEQPQNEDSATPTPSVPRDEVMTIEELPQVPTEQALDHDQVKKRDSKEKVKRKLVETPSMVDPDLVSKKPASELPSTGDNFVEMKQPRSGRSTPKILKKKRDGSQTPVGESPMTEPIEGAAAMCHLVPEMTPEVQRKPPKPKFRTDEESDAKQIKRRLSRKERNVRTPDPFIDDDEHLRHAPTERPMTPRLARAPSPEDRPLVVPLPPPRVQDIPLILPRNEVLTVTDKPPALPPRPSSAMYQSPLEIASPTQSLEIPIVSAEQKTEQGINTEICNDFNVMIPMATDSNEDKPQNTKPKVLSKEEMLRRKRIEEELRFIKQIEATIPADRVKITTLMQPELEVQPLELQFPLVAKANEAVRNSGNFQEICSVEITKPPQTSVLEAQTLPPAASPKTAPKPTITVEISSNKPMACKSSLTRQEQAEDMSEGKSLLQEKLNSAENLRSQYDINLLSADISAQGAQKHIKETGILPVQETETIGERSTLSERISQGNAENQVASHVVLSLKSDKKISDEHALVKETVKAQAVPVPDTLDDKFRENEADNSPKEPGRSLINSLPKPFKTVTNIPLEAKVLQEQPQIQLEEPLEIPDANERKNSTVDSVSSAPSTNRSSPAKDSSENVSPSPVLGHSPAQNESPRPSGAHLLHRPEKRDRDSKVIKAAQYWNNYIGEVLEKKKPPENVKSLEKPKKIVSAGVGQKGYNDLKSAFEQARAKQTSKEEEPVSNSGGLVGGIQRRNSRKIPLEGCTLGLKVTDAKSVFETKYQQPTTPVVYRRTSSNSGENKSAKGKELDEGQTSGPHYIRKKVPEFPPPPISKTPFGTNRLRTGALSPKTVTNEDKTNATINGFSDEAIPRTSKSEESSSIAKEGDEKKKEKIKISIKATENPGNMNGHTEKTGPFSDLNSGTSVSLGEQNMTEQKSSVTGPILNIKSISTEKGSPKALHEADCQNTKPVTLSHTRINANGSDSMTKDSLSTTSNHGPTSQDISAASDSLLVKSDEALKHITSLSAISSPKAQIRSGEIKAPASIISDQKAVMELSNSIKPTVGGSGVISTKIIDTDKESTPKIGENIGVMPNEQISKLQLASSSAEKIIPISKEPSTVRNEEQPAPLRIIPIQIEQGSPKVSSNEARVESVTSPTPSKYEHHIPIHVEGKGTYLNNLEISGPSDEIAENRDSFSTNSLSRRRLGSRKKRLSSAYSDSTMSSTSSAMGPEEDSAYGANFSGLQKYTSIGKHGEPMFRLRKTRPPFAAQRSDSFSSGEEDDFDDDGFREMTAENLFSTLLTRVKSLTRRIHDEHDENFRFQQHHGIINHRLNPGGTHARLERSALRNSLKRNNSSSASALSRQSSMDATTRALLKDEISGLDDGASSVRSYGSSGVGDNIAGGHGRSALQRGSRASSYATQQPHSVNQYPSSSRKGTAMDQYRKISSEMQSAEADILSRLRREAAERNYDNSDMSDGFVSPIDPEFYNDDSASERLRKRSYNLGRYDDGTRLTAYSRSNSKETKDQPRHVTRRSISRELHDFNPSWAPSSSIDFSRSSRERSLGRDSNFDSLAELERRINNRRSESLSRPSLASHGRSLTSSEFGSSSARRLSSGLRSPLTIQDDDNSYLPSSSKLSSSSRFSALDDKSRSDWRRVSVPERGKDLKSLSKKYNRPESGKKIYL